MRVLWISNIAFGPLCELLGQNQLGGGSWLDAAYNSLEKEKELELFVITVSRIKEIRKKQVGRHSFYILPGGNPEEYNYLSLKNKNVWEKIRDECSPDLIQIWGTEFTHGYLALKVMEGIPSIIYMQGLMGQIARHYLSGISTKELLQSITFRDILKFDWILRQQAKFYKRAIIESRIIQLSGNIIVENEWCQSHCKAIAPNCNVFKSKLNIKEEFFKYEWKHNQIKPYTILCNSAKSPIKGLHMLLKAISIVKKIYPETKLIVSGDKSRFEKYSFEKLRINGFTKYLKSTIKELNLKNNIEFVGELTSNQMAEQMVDANVFVMSSSIENHSSTLIEAMIVGTPCISSFVGGISEYLKHNVNGLIYRFEDYEILASHIIKIFEDSSFANDISLNGRNTMRNSRNTNNLKEELLGIYQKVLESN